MMIQAPKEGQRNKVAKITLMVSSKRGAVSHYRPFVRIFED